MATRAKNRKKNFKRHLLPGQGPNFKIISLKCISNAPLPKLLKWFSSAEQMAARAKNRKKSVDCHASVNILLKRHLLLNRLMDFEIISQD